MAVSTHSLFPLPAEAVLRDHFIGRDIADVPAPAAVIDRTIVARHCKNMLDTVKGLGLKFRAHVKTTKTTQITRLQVGEESKEVNLVASTVSEIEHLVPFLKECKAAGRSISVLYGLPLPPSQAARLGQIGSMLGAGSISVMIDDPRQLVALKEFREAAGFAAGIFLKIDTGAHRAGLPPQALDKDNMLQSVAQAEGADVAHLHGVYSHNSHSYAKTRPEEAMAALANELQGCLDAIKHNSAGLPPNRRLVVSIGATPQVLSAQNLSQDRSSVESTTLAKLLDDPGVNVDIELHAGVYPTLDMQQMATHARLSSKSPAEDVALTVIAEVCSLYSEREKPEALIAAGCLALAREPSPDYKGWGVVSPWRRIPGSTSSRLIVDRISQEHGILAYEKNEVIEKDLPLKVGQKVRIWPNHACITGACYGWYLVVDSSKNDPEGDKIVDVWVRWRGW